MGVRDNVVLNKGSINFAKGILLQVNQQLILQLHGKFKVQPALQCSFQATFFSISLKEFTS